MLFSWSKDFLYIPASAADAASVNPNGIKTLLASGLSTFFINGKPAFGNGPRTVPRDSPVFTVLDNWVFDSLILTDELFTKICNLSIS